MGVALTEIGQLDEAIEELSEVLRGNPRNASALNNLAAVFVRKGWDERALPYFGKALELVPDDTDARTNLERVQARLRQRETTLVPSTSPGDKRAKQSPLTKTNPR